MTDNLIILIDVENFFEIILYAIFILSGIIGSYFNNKQKKAKSRKIPKYNQPDYNEDSSSQRRGAFEEAFPDFPLEQEEDKNLYPETETDYIEEIEDPISEKVDSLHEKTQNIADSLDNIEENQLNEGGKISNDGLKVINLDGSDSDQASIDFNLRKAIIYSEILKPKFLSSKDLINN